MKSVPKRGATAHPALVELDPDHPGFRDPIYRARRDAIARLALSHRPGDRVHDVEYTAEEHDVWREIWRHLGPLHEERVCRELLERERHLALDSGGVPQLAEVNAELTAATGFRMEPVAGLVQSRSFLERLGEGVFLATQYIRHTSRPFYTPEPDVVHELVGHAASLTHEGIAELNRLMGRAATGASDREVERLERLYWFVLEFGAVREDGRVKAFGAGLLSSCGELEQLENGPTLEAWDLDEIASTPYDPTSFQARVFVAPSFDRLLGDLTDYVARSRWRDGKAAGAA